MQIPHSYIVSRLSLSFKTFNPLTYNSYSYSIDVPFQFFINNVLFNLQCQKSKALSSCLPNNTACSLDVVPKVISFS